MVTTFREGTLAEAGHPNTGRLSARFCSTTPERCITEDCILVGLQMNESRNGAGPGVAGTCIRWAWCYQLTCPLEL
jgi:hypothetical protein